MRAANRQKILLQNGIDLYNSGAKVINCRLIGSCSVRSQVESKVSKANWPERRRSLPPHSPTKNLGLACQTQLMGDVKVTKFTGFWGEGSQVVWTPKG
jgi:ferredoxin